MNAKSLSLCKFANGQVTMGAVGILLLLFALTLPSAAEPSSAFKNDWREEYAYSLSVQAYIYAFPLIYMSELRYEWTNNPEASFYAALNYFHHKRR